MRMYIVGDIVGDFLEKWNFYVKVWFGVVRQYNAM